MTEHVATPQGSRCSKLPPNLKRQLDEITPSADKDCRYYPCMVRLRDGTSLDRVYLASETPFVKFWGVWPDQDRGKFEVKVEDVASLAESPTRLPAKFANEIYQAGESGMGYVIFTVVFSKRLGFIPQSWDFVTGNAVDFIDYPPGRGPSDVAAVLPHVGRRGADFRSGPKYYWCLYSE